MSIAYRLRGMAEAKLGTRLHVTAALSLLILVSTVMAQYSGGTGEPNDPYQIATAADLIALGETPTDYGKRFVLTADIDLDPNLPGCRVFDRAVISYSMPASHLDYAEPFFSGVFDGRGHKISHLTIAGGHSLGLFGRLISGAIVRNVRLDHANISGSGTGIACLAGANEGGSITACYVDGTVSGGSCVGGLIGLNHGEMIFCESEGEVHGVDEVGGLIGRNGYYASADDDTLVTCCFSTAAVTGDDLVGGLVGYNFGLLRQCFGVGTVSGNSFVGGLAGRCFTDRGGDPYTRVHACFWNTETSGVDISEGGTGLPTAQMQNVDPFLNAGWDFAGEIANGTSEIWQMSEGKEYPTLTIFDGYVPTQLQGAGTADDPYLIHDVRELGAIVHCRSDACYRLESAIDLSGVGWRAAVIPSFSGVFDGKGLTISHLTIAGRDDLGLFGRLKSGAVVRDLGVVDINIVSDSGGFIGGLSGRSEGSVIECYSTGAVTGRYGVGGLLGQNVGSVGASHSVVVIEGEFFVGGLVGRNYSGTLTQCCSSGSVNGHSSVGGLVGGNWSGHVMQCYSRSSVLGEEYVGGLTGYNHDGSVAMSYSSGMVTGTVWSAGGLIGGEPGVASSSFWDMETSGQMMSKGGVGKTTAEMQTGKTFLDAGWDFVGETANGTEDVWWIEEGKDYPRLWWEPPEPVRLPVVELNAATFDAQIAQGVVLVDFYATWCSHCTTQAPIIEEVADHLEGRAQVAKLDIDKSRGIALRYGITSIPTLILFQEGVEVTRFVGVTSADVLVKAILTAAGSSE